MFVYIILFLLFNINFKVEKSIDKNKKVRMSKWHIIPLDQDQLMYAAIDVYVSILFVTFATNMISYCEFFSPCRLAN